MVILITLIIVVAAFLLTVSAILFVVGPILLLQPRRRTAEFYRALGQPTNPAELGLHYEEINVITDDGLKLNSWLIKSASPARGTILYLHGVADCKIDGIRHAKLLHDHGYNVFLHDSRRHGESDGTFCTYGFYEKQDVLRVIDYLVSRTDIKPGKIGIIGTSMGASVALQAAGLDKRIVAVVAENPFATLRSIFDDYQRRIVKLPFHFLRNIVIVRSELMARFKASDVSPLDSVKNVDIPLLFMYGTKDQLINYQYSIALYDQASGPKELYPIENASHNNLWEMAGERYEIKVLEFFERTLA